MRERKERRKKILTKNNTDFDRPSRYEMGDGKQAIDIMEEIFGIDAVIIFACLNCFKYKARLGKKDEIESEENKIKWYEDYIRNNLYKASKRTFEIVAEYKSYDWS